MVGRRVTGSAEMESADSDNAKHYADLPQFFQDNLQFTVHTTGNLALRNAPSHWVMIEVAFPRSWHWQPPIASLYIRCPPRDQEKIQFTPLVI